MINYAFFKSALAPLEEPLMEPPQTSPQTCLKETCTQKHKKKTEYSINIIKTSLKAHIIVYEHLYSSWKMILVPSRKVPTSRTYLRYYLLRPKVK